METGILQSWVGFGIFAGGMWAIHNQPIAWDVVALGSGSWVIGIGLIAQNQFSRSVEKLMERDLWKPEKEAAEDTHEPEAIPAPDGFIPTKPHWKIGGLTSKVKGKMLVHAFDVEMPAFNLERRFAIDILRMYDFDPVSQKHVDATEKRWVIQKKMFSQKPFMALKDDWVSYGLFRRESDKRNARYIVASRDKVAWVAAGHPLPRRNKSQYEFS